MTDRTLIENIGNVYKNISHAAMRAGRNPEEIKLVAVTKTVSVEKIKEAIDAGLRVFGENKVQEAKDKISNFKFHITPPTPPLNNGGMGGLQIEWHLIGHLQKNKAKTAVELFDLIHSVDSFELAEIINKHAEKMDKIQNILLQVKLSDEPAKSGISKYNLMSLLSEIKNLSHLNILGLMIMPPFFDNPEMARKYFKELRSLRDNAMEKGFSLPELSMGMTNDFEIAIEEGATMVRIGTAIFGKRKRAEN